MISKWTVLCASTKKGKQSASSYLLPFQRTNPITNYLKLYSWRYLIRWWSMKCHAVVLEQMERDKGSLLNHLPLPWSRRRQPLHLCLKYLRFFYLHIWYWVINTLPLCDKKCNEIYLSSSSHLYFSMSFFNFPSVSLPLTFSLHQSSAEFSTLLLGQTGNSTQAFDYAPFMP